MEKRRVDAKITADMNMTESDVEIQLQYTTQEWKNFKNNAKEESQKDLLDMSTTEIEGDDECAQNMRKQVAKKIAR